MKFTLRVLIVTLFFFACEERKDAKNLSVQNAEPQKFTSVSPDYSGLHFVNKVQESQGFNYLIYPFIYFGGGVAIADINNDGLPDVYLTSNMGHNGLYLNKGELKFEDITKSAGVEGVFNHWTTGVTITDINNDGFIDFYVSVAGPGETRKNLLYLNQKNNTFKEEAEKYRIADTGHSIQSSFFDFDNDGDLDLYVSNYPISGFNRKSDFFYEKLQNPSLQDSDKLYRNDNGVFKDVTKSSGILNYGLTLGLSISDFNNDGWSDIYVSNDFNSSDFLYINQQNGTFSNEILSYTGHTSNFGMGTDTGDINNDGFVDLIQLDMMGSTNQQQKANMSAMNTPLFYDMVDKGLHHQYMKNTLQLNTGLNSFMEIGELAGIAYTNWSWGSLLFDMDNDGFKDIFITNGMRRNVNDNDFNALFRIQNAYGNVHKNEYLNWIKRMPVEPVENVAFKNTGKLRYQKLGAEYGLNFKGFSNGAAYADLDLDGDLDIVVNNIDAKAGIFKNNSSDINSGSYLRIKLKGEEDNSFGIGARVTIFKNDTIRIEELQVTRGYESAVEPIAHFGLKDNTEIDSLRIDWPKGNSQKHHNIKANQLLEISQSTSEAFYQNKSSNKVLLKPLELNLSPKFVHKENDFNDFEPEVLLPHKMSQFGPALAVSDINNDGLDDFFVGGAKGYSSKLYIQNTEGVFTAIDNPLWNTDKNYEDTSALFFDANNDGFKDLYVVSGGNENFPKNTLYRDRLYLNNQKGSFYKSEKALPVFYSSGSCVKVIDYDKDGDLDLFIGGRQVPGKYPTPPDSYILENKSTTDEVNFVDRTFQVAPNLQKIGMVTDASIADINGDGWEDLIVVGEWMAPTILLNRKGDFENKSEAYATNEYVGWWNAVKTFDIDNDGDLDFIAGNLGLNYKYKASKEEPFKIFANDFDDNGNLDIVLGYYDSGELYPLRGRECSSQQIPSIKKKFENYTTFSKASLEDVYTPDLLKKSLSYEATTFANTVFINEGNSFIATPLPNAGQISSVNAFQLVDVNNDTYLDILMAGNLYDSEVETARSDASYGQLLLNNGDSTFDVVSQVESGMNIKGEVRGMQKLTMANGSLCYLFARNNEALVLMSFNSIDNN